MSLSKKQLNAMDRHGHRGQGPLGPHRPLLDGGRPAMAPANFLAGINLRLRRKQKPLIVSPPPRPRTCLVCCTIC